MSATVKDRGEEDSLGCLGHSCFQRASPALDQLHQSRTLLELPIVALENILKYMSYEEISQLRLVCKHLDVVCQHMLNKGFLRVKRYHYLSKKQVKAQLASQESIILNHPLAGHSDILATVDRKLSLLNITIMLYVNFDLCCFIPGKVIDEINRVLQYVNSTRAPLSEDEVLQELKDLSSLAMKHFEEKIVPILKTKLAACDVEQNVHLCEQEHKLHDGMESAVGTSSGTALRGDSTRKRKKIMQGVDCPRKARNRM